jgi:crossover junction endodeoxyribonuclease RuvC
VIVVGIDPGTQKVGYAVLKAEPGRVTVVDVGVWRLVRGGSRPALGLRLEELFEHATMLFEKWNPRLIGLEKAVAFKSVPAALTLAEARGVVRLAAHTILDRAEARMVEISPTRVKRSATGTGTAKKGAVTKLVGLRFPELSGLTSGELPHDAYDAVAIAWSAWIDGRGKARGS